MAIRQPFVIQAEQVQDRRVKVVYVDFVRAHRAAVLIAFAVAEATRQKLDAEKAGYEDQIKKNGQS